jgi:NitT/TauT family transport system permease protein
MTLGNVRINVWGTVLLLGIGAGWQALAVAYGSPVFPGPMQIAKAMVENRDAIAGSIGITLKRALMAFGAAAVTMVPFGILCGRLRWLGRIVDPFVEFLITVPPPAVIPLVMLFAGVGDDAKIAVIFYACAPLILVNTMEGARNTPPMLEQVARSLRFSRLKAMAQVSLPATMPAIITGIRLAIATSLLVSVTSEMLLATDGIGTFLQRSQESFEFAAGLGAIATISIAGLCMNLIVKFAEKRILFWYYRDGPT